jgi:hypothetical protein
MRIESCEDAIVTLDFNPFFYNENKKQANFFSKESGRTPTAPKRERER